MLSEQDSLHVLQQKVSVFPQTVVILGTGWNQVVNELEVETEIGYRELFDVEATVPGHEGKVVIGKLSGKRVALMVGRFHMYEGYSAREATLPIRVFAQAGMKQLITTAACGALNEKYQVGDFVLLNDVITLFLALDNPLRGPQFLDVSEVFDHEMRKVARKVLIEQEVSFKEGVYVYYHGPNFETPADKMALKFLGGDVVGMSTVPEVLAARWLKVKVLSFAFVTNLAFVKHDHLEVLAESQKAAGKMSAILADVIKAL